MTTKHTPGPWAYARHEQFGRTTFYVAQADGAGFTPHYSDVASVVSETCAGEMLGIQEANARLIAAAPDLLEALIELTEEYINEIESEWSGTGSYKAMMSKADKARAAIAKATGGQP